jgi:predicted metal-dependent phosphoesterase TrpH
MRLVVGPWFVVLAPLYDIWDAMTLLPLAGHLAILGAAVAGYVVWRSRVVSRHARRFDWRELVRASAALAGLLAWYAVGAIAPRPMAALHVDDRDAVVVDFHSHTDASHDGRYGFSAERNREWHRGAGFDVAYITDHGTFAAVGSALTRNPAHAGDGTVLLPGLETRYAGQHLNVIGFAAESTYRALPPSFLASFSRRSRPTALLTIPALVDDASSRTPTDGPIVAIEIVDGSPRGLAFGIQQRDALEQLSAHVGAALVAGSNNHGWGRAAPGWTVLEIPGWRRLTPSALDSAILATLAHPDRGRVVVVERRAPEPAGKPELVADVARVVRNPFRTLGGAEQLAWIAWMWLGWWVARLVERRSHRRA